MSAPALSGPGASVPAGQTIPVWPQPPAPPVPPPQAVSETVLQPPMVLVPPRWEYRHLTRPESATGALEEPELNRLGQEGWELLGVVALAGAVHFYFKREVV